MYDNGVYLTVLIHRLVCAFAVGVQQIRISRRINDLFGFSYGDLCLSRYSQNTLLKQNKRHKTLYVSRERSCRARYNIDASFVGLFCSFIIQLESFTLCYKSRSSKNHGLMVHI